MRLPLTGGCLCGAVRYEISTEPVDAYVCHCRDCQKSTSSAFSIGIVVLDGACAISGLDKTELVFGGVAENGGRRKFKQVCSGCGTWLFGEPRKFRGGAETVRIVRGGTFDDTSWIQPTRHIWTRSRQAWVVLPEGVACFETQPPPAPT